MKKMLIKLHKVHITGGNLKLPIKLHLTFLNITTLSTRRNPKLKEIEILILYFKSTNKTFDIFNPQ